MKKATLNFYINALMFLCMSAIAGIGFLIKYTLITGRESQIIYGNNVRLSFLGMGRHEWGTIHLIISFLFLGLLGLHLYLHWKTIICVFNKLIPQNVHNKIILFSFIMVSSLLMILPFFIKPKIDGISNRNEQHRTINKGQEKKSKVVNLSMNSVQNKQQRISKTQRFIDVDTNRDGFIGQDEHQFGAFNEFDTDQDGKLSRTEYQKKNRSTKRNGTRNYASGRNRGKGNCQVTQRGNCKKNGTGVCRNDNQCFSKNNNKNTRGRRS